MTPEGKVKKAFVDAARKHGLAYINLIDTGDKGNPDKIALPPGGTPAFIEFKREAGGVVSPEQYAKVKRYRDLGYKCFFISTKNGARALAWALMHVGGWENLIESHLIAYAGDQLGY